MTQVLLAEDDPAIAEPLARALGREGYDVRVQGTGQGAIDGAAAADLVVLDLGLPDMDGLDVARAIRNLGLTTPVLVLTARADEVDFVVGLDAGADDYVAKPFRLAELLAPIRALLRRRVPGVPEGRGGARVPEVLEAGGVRMDLGARLVTVDLHEVQLANKEFELLRVLMSRAGQVVSRDEILAEVWNDLESKTSKTLDMHMSWVRRKLAIAADEAAGRASKTHDGERRIATVRGVGFRFNAE